MTHKQRKWIQKTKSRPPGLRGRTGQTFSSRYTSIIKITMGGVTFDTTIQEYGLPHGWRSQGWRQDAADKRSERSRKGQANYLWIPRRSGYIYKGPSPLGDTLSHNTLLHHHSLDLLATNGGVDQYNCLDVINFNNSLNDFTFDGFLLMMTRGSTTSAGTQDQFCQ